MYRLNNFAAWILLLVGTLLCTRGAYAQTHPVTACYTTAEAANSGRVMSVLVSGDPVLTTASISSFMQKVAELHTNTAASVSLNTSGRAAVRAAMACIWDEGYVTLSSVFLNEKVGTLSLRPTTVRVTEGGVFAGQLDFSAMGEACGGAAALEFRRHGNSVLLPMTAFGAYDFTSNIVALPPTTPPTKPLCNSKECDGDCYASCVDGPEGWSTECECSSLGSCAPTDGTFSIGTTAVIVLAI